MKDDSLSDVQNVHYCSMCDTSHTQLNHSCGVFPFAAEKPDSVGKQENVYAKQIWNDAIEAAAKCVEQANRDGPYQAIVAHREIRKLKQ